MAWLNDAIDTIDNPGAPVTSTRTLDTEFTPSATKYTLVSYVVQLAVAGGASASVELRSDAASPPTTVRDVASLAVVGSGDTVTIKMKISHLVQPGHVVKLVSAGTTPTITAVQVETIIS